MGLHRKSDGMGDLQCPSMDPFTLLGVGFEAATLTLKAVQVLQKSKSKSGRQQVAEVAQAVRNPACLLAAVRRGDAELVEMLLEMGADRNIDAGHKLRFRNEDVVGVTPLMVAAGMDNVSMVHVLLHHGADIDAAARKRSGTRCTALVFAAICGKYRAARLLLQEGDTAGGGLDDLGVTLLMAVVGNGDEQMAELLAEYGADVDEEGTYGWTALHYAAFEGRGAIAVKLLRVGADAGVETSRRRNRRGTVVWPGRTAFDVAWGRGNTRLAAMIRSC
ncbi:hypothetical protein CHLNCDRAFT_133163 [Chlorella variabilis]|uniref:Uncharacterized protein n=1 Tax=Chlorella variabilis TaxID=554065 RepID=E1Z2H8_CHLVA|nr:hypothetical protein CHLNCDRAFT_133163 [Chlorella variabilis]EFN60001.1 hypothetical protein CHLNCDRAFT_133163 [Chlorella variabilis]|eukprot:XP_005852103.1 hypothetical protein CHLNCDRAFT_133163 [Chlorella variabilis]